MVSFVGGVVCAFTGFLLPPAIYIRLRSKLFYMNIRLNIKTNENILVINEDFINNIDNQSIINYDDDIINYTIKNDIDTLDSCTRDTSDNIMLKDIENINLSRWFKFGLISIMAFGFGTMISTVIFTMVDINSRNTEDH